MGAHTGNGSLFTISKDTRRERAESRDPQRRFRVHVGPPLLPLSMPSAPFGTCRQRLEVVPWAGLPSKTRSKVVVTSRAATRRRARTQRLLYFTLLPMAMTLPVSLATRTGTPRNRRRPRPAKAGCLPAMGRAATTKQQPQHHHHLHHFGPPPRPGPRRERRRVWKPPCPPPSPTLQVNGRAMCLSRQCGSSSSLPPFPLTHIQAPQG